jgi:hypothetical protein
MHPDHETLLAVGVTLIMAGIVLRGFAAQSRRDLARRKQHQLDARKSGEALLNEQLDRPPTWLEKHFGLLANVILVAGVLLTVAGYWFR